MCKNIMPSFTSLMPHFTVITTIYSLYLMKEITIFPYYNYCGLASAVHEILYCSKIECLLRIDG